jgi:hypothetical protein
VPVRLGQEVQEVPWGLTGPARRPDQLVTWPHRSGHACSLADQVDVAAPKGPPDLPKFVDDPPDAVVIDLDRRPSEGLVMGIQLRRDLVGAQVLQTELG